MKSYCQGPSDASTTKKLYEQGVVEGKKAYEQGVVEGLCLGCGLGCLLCCRDSAETVLPPRSQTTSLKRIVGGGGPPNSRAMRSAFLGRYGVIICVVHLLRVQRLCFVLFSPQLLVSCPHQPFFCICCCGLPLIVNSPLV